MSAAPAVIAAQRRPERQPRLHPVGDRRRVVACPRSTKAGASTPATRGQSVRSQGTADQRSTKAGASTPATHGSVLVWLVARGRSTKAGASTPATLARPSQRWVRERRSTKAGASTPATPAGPPPEPRLAASLNEGRSVNPGYTRDVVAGVANQRQRSTKAGASTPATREQRLQHQLGRQRSTKAGASTPATPPIDLGPSSPDQTLNEGRSVNPGYTHPVSAIAPTT